EERKPFIVSKEVQQFMSSSDYYRVESMEDVELYLRKVRCSIVKIKYYGGKNSRYAKIILPLLFVKYLLYILVIVPLSCGSANSNEKTVQYMEHTEFN